MVGRWEPVTSRFKYLPIHMALLHTGKVLAFGGSGNDERRLRNPYPAELWDSQTGVVSEVPTEGVHGDLFCVGHTFLSDGRLFMAGGTHRYDGKLFGLPIPPFRGLDHCYIFNPDDLTWTRFEDMANGRWYPTLVRLPENRVLAVAGLTKGFPWVFLRTLEIYQKGKGWRKLSGAGRWLPLYPRLHLLPSGEVYYSGSFNTHYTFPFSIKFFPSAVLNVETGKWRSIGSPSNVNREEGASVLLPLLPPDYKPRILLVSGGTPQGNDAITDVEMIDLSEADPHWKRTAPLKHSRYYTYAVILPDKRILVLGGKRGAKGHDPHIHEMESRDGEVPQNPLAVREPEIFHIEDESWTTMVPMTVDRLYHSNALLLPDARVMVAGSNPHRRVNELRIEIFDPPYLFRGQRPEIIESPSEIRYGHTFEITTDDGYHISDVALLHPSATTHCTDADQRYVGLRFSVKGSRRLQLEPPPNENITPPGYYMLFILKEGGIPSIARFVRLSA